MPKPSPRARLTSPTPHTPIPSPFSRALSGSPSPSPSRAAVAVESTFQRTFRGILRNLETIYRNWDILHGQGLSILQKSANGKKPTDEPSLELINVFQKLARQHELLKTVRKHLDDLLQDMSKRRGLEATFDEPLFLTWSLGRLYDGLLAAIAIFSQTFHSLRSVMADLELGVPAKVALRFWKDHAIDDHRVLEEILEICHVELSIEEDGD